jgi:hypothetical protein
MNKFGRFEKGVFHRNEGVAGKKTQDSFQATWEYINKRPMVLAQPQYNDPIMMDTENYRWKPLGGSPGVEEKAFGTFTECKIRAARYKLDPGATFRATGRGIYLVLSGGGSLEGQPYRRLTSLYVDTAERRPTSLPSRLRAGSRPGGACASLDEKRTPLRNTPLTCGVRESRHEGSTLGPADARRRDGRRRAVGDRRASRPPRSARSSQC